LTVKANADENVEMGFALKDGHDTSDQR
jgi:hypothetical protein